MPELPVIRVLKYDFNTSPPLVHITFYHNGIKSGNWYQNNKNRSNGGLS